MTPVQLIAMESQVFELITLILGIFGVGIEVYQWIKDPSQKYWIASRLSWLLHVVFFYTFLTLNRYTTLNLTPLFGSYTLWSSLLRLHVVGTVVILEWYRFAQRKLRFVKEKVEVNLDIVKKLTKNKEERED